MKLISKVLKMVRIKGITQFCLPPTRLSTNGMSHPAFTPSRRALPHFGRYSFPVPLRVGGWVGLGGWMHTEVLPAQRYTHQTTNRPIVRQPGFEPTTIESQVPNHYSLPSNLVVVVVDVTVTCAFVLWAMPVKHYTVTLKEANTHKCVKTHAGSFCVVTLISCVINDMLPSL